MKTERLIPWSVLRLLDGDGDPLLLHGAAGVKAALAEFRADGSICGIFIAPPYTEIDVTMVDWEGFPCSSPTARRPIEAPRGAEAARRHGRDDWR